MAKLIDVAEKAKVSTATVSRVLSGSGGVSDALRERVMAAVDALQYRPNRLAQNLRKQSSPVIGLLVSDIRNPFFTAVARAIEDVAQAEGVSLFLCNTDEDHDKEVHYLNTLMEQQVAGIIFVPSQESSAAFQFLLNSDMPIVTIDRRLTELNGASVDSVLCDNVQSAENLTTHLIENGYKRIAAVIGLQESMTGRERMQGYKLAHLNHDLTPDPALMQYVYPREKEAAEWVHTLLTLPEPPDAIVAGNVRITLGAINAINDAGLDIPADIALAGFDETSWMRHVAGGVTVISQPMYEMGKTAAELLFKRIQDNSRPSREVVLKGELIVRKTTTYRTNFG